MKIFNFFILFFGLQSLIAQPTLDTELVASGFSRPVSIVHANDDRLFILEQVGRIKIIDGVGNVIPEAFLNIQDRVNDSGNEQGLLGLAFPPDYATSGVFYVNYTAGTGSGNTRISRFKVDPADPNKALADSEEIILTFNQPFTNHNGGDLNFGPDGYLYISEGDGGSANDPGNRAQNLNQYLGKILRIDVDTIAGYKIPASNPFVGVSTALPEIWSYGLRNPWRFSFDRATGDMWIGDVGQNAWEEVDFEPSGISGGVNYGWKCYEGNQLFTGTTACQSIDDVGPVFVYPHNDSTGGFSISGGFVYRGDEYPELNGNYIFADYVSGNFWMTSRNDETDEWMTFRQDDLLFDVSGFGEDQEGNLYAARLSGAIYKISGDCPDSTATFTLTEQNDTIFANTFGSNIQWYLNGVAIDGANQNFIVPESNGEYFCEAVVNVSGCHYNALSDTINRLDCGDTALIINLILENDTLKPSVDTGTFVWYLDGEVIAETQPFHIPLEVGEYYVEVTQDVEECILFGQSDTFTTECDQILCDAVIVLQNDTLFAECAFGTLTWFLDDVQIAVTGDEEEGFVIPTASGEYQVIAYDSIAVYCVRQDTAILNVVINSVLNSSSKSLTLFPNPSSKIIQTTFEGRFKQTKVLDVQGRMQNLTPVVNGQNLILDISKLPVGNYFIEIKTASENYVGQFIKE